MLSNSNQEPPMQTIQPPWMHLQLHSLLNHHHNSSTLSLFSHQPRSSSPSPSPSPSSLVLQCALTKQGQKFLTSITNAPDPSHTHRLINKFVNSSSKTVVLGTLSHLLSPKIAFTQPHLSSLAFPLYTTITQVSWFSWNSKLVANVIALLYKQGRIQEAEALIKEAVSTICSKERDLVSFYCNLMDCHTKLKSQHGFSCSYMLLKELLSTSSSVYVRKRAYESLVGGLCVMDRPQEAEDLINEMMSNGIKPSAFEFRSIIEGYGRLGLFEEMVRSVAEMEKNGFALDTITSNMVISSFGVHNELSEMVLWLQKVKSLGIVFSIRTYNSVLNSCPTVTSFSQDPKNGPISLKDLLSVLRGDEGTVVKELIGLPVSDEIMTWDSSESKLDLHGMHLGTSYLILLQWMEELPSRFTSGNYEVPAEITVVCGSGKHSSVRGESPVKALVREIMLRAKSPLRIDRKNIGCFVAKGKAVKDWLC